MPLALPDGYTDTGSTRSVTVSCTVRLTNLSVQGAALPGPGNPPPSDLSGWIYADITIDGLMPGGITYAARIAGTTASLSGPLYQRQVYLIAAWLPQGWVQLE